MEYLRRLFCIVLLAGVLAGFSADTQSMRNVDTEIHDESIDIAPEAIDVLSLSDVTQARVMHVGPIDPSVQLVKQPPQLAFTYDAAPNVVPAGSILSSNSVYLVNSEIPFAIAFISLGGFIIVGCAIMVKESYLRQKD